MTTDLATIDPGQLDVADVAGFCTAVVEWAQGTDDLAAVLEGRARLDALAAYLDAKSDSASDAYVHTMYAQRLLEVRIGELLGPARRGRPLKTETSVATELSADERCDFRKIADANIVTISGTPIRYGVEYSVTDQLGKFTERMEKGVARKVLADPNLDCRLLIGHRDDSIPLARTRAGTMHLHEDDGGLRMRADLDSRRHDASDLARAIERGDVSQLSVSFVVGDDVWNDDYTHRSIRSIESLLETSVVAFPASPSATVSLANGDGKRATPCVCVGHGPSCATDVPCCSACKFASPLPGRPQGDSQGQVPNYSMGGDSTGTRKRMQLELDLIRLRVRPRPVKVRK